MPTYDSIEYIVAVFDKHLRPKAYYFYYKLYKEDGKQQVVNVLQKTV